MAEKFNMKNPSVKRILQEVKEMQSNPSDDFISLPLEENIFELQFAIRGPRDTEFEGGIYHGRIQLPNDYPFKPPSFMLLTPNGRFEIQTKICLSISNYHPEHWQPSWSVPTALVALIAFMPTNPGGALGSLDYNKEERRKLATKSRQAAPSYGSPERQKTIDQIHQYMLDKAPPMPQLAPTTTTEESVPEDPQTNPDSNVGPGPEVPLNPEPEQVAEDVHEVRVDAVAGGLRVGFIAGMTVSMPANETAGQTRTRTPPSDRLFTWAALGLAVAIVVLVMKKFLKSNGIADYSNEL